MPRICSVDGCGRKTPYKHLCSMHYKRKRKYGDVGPPDTYKPGAIKKSSREYYSFYAMKTRCRYTHHKQYKDYGGRGIKVCDRWLEPKLGFKNFLKDMGERPEGCSLDRIDVNKDYCPENCRWATRKEQSNNMRNNKTLIYQGNAHTLSEWSKILNIPSYIIRNRIDLYGWTVEEALSKQYKKRK